MKKNSQTTFVRALILAAGKGTRMNPATTRGKKIPSPTPKVLHKIAGKPIISYLLKTLDKLKIPATLVVGYKAKLVKRTLGGQYDYVYQAKQEGTGHAVQIARPVLAGKSQCLFVLMGDAPFISPATLKKMLEMYQTKRAKLVIATMMVSNPSFYGFGRIDRDKSGKVREIVEQKNTNPKQQRIKECNAGFYLFDSSWCWRSVGLLGRTLKGEIPLTDLVKIAYSQDKKISTVKLSLDEAIGINTREQARQAEKIIARRL